MTLTDEPEVEIESPIGSGCRGGCIAALVSMGIVVLLVYGAVSLVLDLWP